MTYCDGCDRDIVTKYMILTETPANLKLCIYCLKIIIEDNGIKEAIEEEFYNG